MKSTPRSECCCPCHGNLAIDHITACCDGNYRAFMPGRCCILFEPGLGCPLHTPPDPSLMPADE